MPFWFQSFPPLSMLCARQIKQKYYSISQHFTYRLGKINLELINIYNMNYDLIDPRSLVDIIEPEGLNGDDQIKAQDVQIETIYLKNLIN